MAMPALLMDADSIIDAEFESVVPQHSAAGAVKPKLVVPQVQITDGEGLSILRGDNPQANGGDLPEQLTPAFLFFTALAAFAVFWVCGGRVLLY
ncbi:MAG: hypothetical protein WCC66_03340 [Rhizobiaceae bacterium]